MKFTIEQNHFSQAITKAIGAVERRNTIPILGNFKIEAAHNELRVTATDLDLEITAVVPADVSSHGVTTVSAQMLQGVISKLPKGKQVSVEANEKGDLIVKSGRSEVTFETLPAEDFPSVSADGFKAEFTLPSTDLKRIFDLTSVAVSTEETRYYLNGVFLHNADGVIKAVSTDGHRLALVETKLTQEIPSVIVPRKTVSELRKNEAGEVMVQVSDQKIRFIYDGLVITSKVIDGTFPDYTRVIPKGNHNTLTCDADEVKAAVSLVSQVVSDKTRSVVMTVTSDTLHIQAGLGVSQGHQELEILHDGPDIRIGFNAKYVTELMDLLRDGRVELAFSEPMSPMTVKPDGDIDVMFVMMPMRS